MKKILTLFVMLLATAGILSAQNFSYQAVVRNHDDATNQDTLVHDTEIKLTVQIFQGTSTTPVYTETHAQTTSPNGLVSILIGDGTTTDDMNLVDWSDATLKVSFYFTDDTEIGVSEMKVQPVPYAIQAGGGNLTTQQIADYVRDVLTYDQAAEIWQAIVNNPNNLKNGIKDTVIKYMKAHKDIAKEVAEAYFDYLDANNMQEVYNALNGNTDVKNQLKQRIIDYLKDHPEIAKDIVLYYLQNATTEDVNSAYNMLMSMPTATKQALKNRIVDYVKNHRALAQDAVLYLLSTTTTNEANLAINYLHTTNPQVWGQMRDSLNIYIDRYMDSVQNAGNDLAVAGVDEAALNGMITDALAGHDFVVDTCATPVNLCELSDRIEYLDEISQETEPTENCVSFGDGTAEVTPNGLFIEVNVTLPTGLEQYPQVSFAIIPAASGNGLGQQLTPIEIGNNANIGTLTPVSDVDMINGQYNESHTKVYASLNASEIADYEPGDYIVRPVVEGADICTPVPTYPFNICEDNTSKPTFEGITHTDGLAKTTLFSNNGVILKAKVNLGDFANNIKRAGYLISRDPISGYDPADCQVLECQLGGANNDSLYGTASIEYCGEETHFRPFVILKGYCDSIALGADNTFTMWAPELTVSSQPVTDGIELNAEATMEVGAWSQNYQSYLAFRNNAATLCGTVEGCPSDENCSTYCNNLPESSEEATKLMEEWMTLLHAIKNCCPMWSVIQSSIQNMFGIEDPADVEFKYVWEENEDPFAESTTGKVVVPNVPSEYTAKAILTINDKQCVVTKNIAVQ